MQKPINILISGSNYWNPGDDIVREGVMALLRASVFPRDINWHFFNFAAPVASVGPCGEIPNTVEIRDINRLAPRIDLVVIPGLAFGRELAQFQMKLLECGLGPKTIFLGGMNENDYAAKWAAHSSTRRLLKQAKLVIGRTTKYPATLRTDGIGYKVLPCPSILCDFPSEEVREGGIRFAYSIQLPQGSPFGVVNHTVVNEAHTVALQSLRETIKKHSVDLICHHKSEFSYWSEIFKDEAKVRVLFSSWFQDLWAYYKACDVVVSTRLHAVLWARALGKPGIVVNDSNRHQGALEHFPGTSFSLRAIDVAQFVSNINRKSIEEFSGKCAEHRNKVFEAYMKELEPHVKGFKLS